MKFGIIVFPGSNCDKDCRTGIEAAGFDTGFIWHRDTSVAGYDCLVLPGGFSYGDYLRPGAIARFSPIMDSVARFASDGKPVLGIGNGFQILLEAGLLPGAMRRNAGTRFICDWINVRVESEGTPFTSLYAEGDVLTLPVAHGSGNYFAHPDVLAQLNTGGQVVLRYCNELGEAASRANPNGSLENIAGICNETGHVVGIMPHPERACEAILGGTDGRRIFESAAEWVRGGVRVGQGA
jgi:phosphoribosylformylglycinamidine synthase I